MADYYRPDRGHKIERLYAWICTEEDGGEGLPAFTTLDDMIMPMVGADRERIESLRPIAREIARAPGLPVRLVCFETLIEIERLTDA